MHCTGNATTAQPGPPSKFEINQFDILRSNPPCLLQKSAKLCEICGQFKNVFDKRQISWYNASQLNIDLQTGGNLMSNRTPLQYAKRTQLPAGPILPPLSFPRNGIRRSGPVPERESTNYQPPTTNQITRNEPNSRPAGVSPASPSPNTLAEGQSRFIGEPNFHMPKKR